MPLFINILAVIGWFSTSLTLGLIVAWWLEKHDILTDSDSYDKAAFSAAAFSFALGSVGFLAYWL
jgi:hypothetical protein